MIEPIRCRTTATVSYVAGLMRDEDTRDVLIEDDQGIFCGSISDREIVVRCVAERHDPRRIEIAEVCTAVATTVSPETPIDQALETMRRVDVQWLPVVAAKRLAGVVHQHVLVSESSRRRDRGKPSASGGSRRWFGSQGKKLDRSSGSVIARL